jgi:hypothetical protein
MTVDEINKAVLALTAWNVAGKVSYPACVAALFVVRNILEKNADNDWLRACDEAWGGGVYEYPDTRNPEFLKIVEVVDSVYENIRVDNLSNNALYFEPGDGREECAVVGTLKLYKDARK